MSGAAPPPPAPTGPPPAPMRRPAPALISHDASEVLSALKRLPNTEHIVTLPIAHSALALVADDLNREIGVLNEREDADVSWRQDEDAIVIQIRDHGESLSRTVEQLYSALNGTGWVHFDVVGLPAQQELIMQCISEARGWCEDHGMKMEIYPLTRTIASGYAITLIGANGDISQATQMISQYLEKPVRLVGRSALPSAASPMGLS